TTRYEHLREVWMSYQSPEATRSLASTPSAAEEAQSLSLAMHTLRRCDLCQGLRPTELHDIARAVRLLAFRSGEVICRQNDPGDSMYIVAKGRVRVAVELEDGDHRLLDYLGRGE